MCLAEQNERIHDKAMICNIHPGVCGRVSQDAEKQDAAWLDTVRQRATVALQDLTL